MQLKYVQSCLNFINEEQKSARKEQWRLVNMKDSDHNDEGSTIIGATAVRKEKGSTVFSYPPQFTKLREEKRVSLYQNKRVVMDSEVLDVDYIKHEVTLQGDFSLGQKFLIIQSNDVTPRAIVASLKKLQEEGSELAENLLNRNSNIKTFGEGTVPNILKTVQLMDASVLTLQGCPGAGKTHAGRHIIQDLLKNGKTVAVTSNSHSAINNLCASIDYVGFKGAKICARKNQHIKHDQFENVYVQGMEIDVFVKDHNVVAGTCFALSRIMHRKFDFVIVDEASQLKMSFLLSVARIAKNIIVLGDQNQLQSITQIDMAPGGESVLDFILQGAKIVPASQGYLLGRTYRMQPKIANIISQVFYEGKMTWEKTEKTSEVKLITSNHDHGQKMSKEEATDVLKIYKQMLKKKYKPEEIMVVTPYNAQVGLLKATIKNNKVQIGTCDLFQGKESKVVILSMVAAGNKKESSEFCSNSNRLNVAISRGIEKVFIIASPGLQKSEDTSPEFKQVLKMIS